MSKYVDTTPTWESLIDPMILVLQNPKAPAESVGFIAAELNRLAQIVDGLPPRNNTESATYESAALVAGMAAGNNPEF